MTKYKCRREGFEWFEISAGTPAEAAQDYFYDNDESGIVFWHNIPQGREQIRFAVIEVENYGKFVCRVYRSGIWRTIMKQKPERLREIADKLGWKRDPHELIESGWDHESINWNGR